MGPKIKMHIFAFSILSCLYKNWDINIKLLLLNFQIRPTATTNSCLDVDISNKNAVLAGLSHWTEPVCTDEKVPLKNIQLENGRSLCIYCASLDYQSNTLQSLTVKCCSVKQLFKSCHWDRLARVSTSSNLDLFQCQTGKTGTKYVFSLAAHVTLHENKNSKEWQDTVC